ncbi:hypothetical protein E2542_SST02423 [Spatholobus suberectus]|nr:hypothetical protein E2542_SST02423 [Spatholobus suberectus]
MIEGREWRRISIARRRHRVSLAQILAIVLTQRHALPPFALSSPSVQFSSAATAPSSIFSPPPHIRCSCAKLFPYVLEIVSLGKELRGPDSYSKFGMGLGPA